MVCQKFIRSPSSGTDGTRTQAQGPNPEQAETRSFRAARKADIRIDRLKRKLRRRATESSASGEQLEQAIALREAAEASAEARAVRRDKLLAEALRIQKRLRNRVRGILSEQEGERKRLGGELCDEVAQALLAIDRNLLALKTSGTDKTKKSIADAQRILQELRVRGRMPGGR